MIADLREPAIAFAKRLADVKKSLGDTGFEWYPYDTLANVRHLDELLTGQNRNTLDSEGRGRRVLDLCCGDGAMSFFLESLGYEVVAVDHPVYNHNGMRGVNALKAALGSSVEILEIDLDRQFTMPAGQFSIVLFLGALYHLKNPWFILEELARHAERCVMSTRVANRYPNGSAMPPGVPIAYLLDEDSLNNDDSNYFIFSEAGLRLLLRRTQWEILDYSISGVKGSADPTSLDRDQRIFCLLGSRYGKVGGMELLDGWYEPEGEGWRWTKQRFSARSLRRSGARLVLEVFVPEQLTATGPAQLTFHVEGKPLDTIHLDKAGHAKFVRAVPAGVGSGLIEGVLNRSVPANFSAGRELGLIVKSLTIE